MPKDKSPDKEFIFYQEKGKLEIFLEKKDVPPLSFKDPITLHPESLREKRFDPILLD